MQRHTGFFQDYQLSEFDMKTTILEEENNIHLRIRSRIPDEGHEDVRIAKGNFIDVILDINNRNQIDGLMNTTFEELINFADRFNRDRLIDVLNNQFN